MRFMLPLVIGLTILAQSSVLGEEERSMSLSQCVELALHSNLDLESGEQSPWVARFALREARSVYEPVLTAELGRQSSTSPGGVDRETKQLFPGATTRQDRYGFGLRGQLPSGSSYSFGANRTRTSGSQAGDRFFNESGFVGLEIRQPLLRNLWIDSSRLQIALGKMEVAMSEYGFQALLMEIITEVEIAYYDLLAARDGLTIRQQSYDLAAELVRSHQKQVVVGRMARLDEKQAQARMAASEAALFAARNIVTERENALKLLITDDFAQWADRKILPTTALPSKSSERSREQSWKHALTHRPDIQQAQLALSQAHVRLRFEKNQRYPSLDLTASYGFAGRANDVRNQRTPSYGIGIELNIPIGNGRARAREKAQAVRKRQALLAYKKLEQQVMAEIANALSAVDSSFRRVDATRQAREFAEVALAAEQKKLANGKSTNFIVLQLQADLTEARLNETLAMVDYQRALSALALREASTLDVYAIALQSKPTAPLEN